MISNAKTLWVLCFYVSCHGITLHFLVFIHILMDNSKSTRPIDMFLHLKDTLSIKDDKLFKAYRSVCSFVRNLLMWLNLALGPV